MATVIRAAKISGEQVVLPAPGYGLAAGAVSQAPRPPESGAAPAPSHAALPEQGSLDPATALLAGLEQREQRLAERERLFQEEQEAQRSRVAEEARREGYARGEADAAAAQRERLAALERVLASLQQEFAGQIEGLEDVMVAIAFEAVCKIVGDAMHGVDGVRAVVRAVMAKVRDGEQLVLHLSPQDYKLLREERERLFGAGEDGRHALAPDHRVVLGGCLIETSGGTIDGRLETQMQKLRDTLAGARKAIAEPA